MAIVIESTANNVAWANSTDLTISKPAGVVSGDLMVFCGFFEVNTTITAPSGWTQITNTTHTANNFKLATYYKIAGGSEPADYTWSWTNSRNSAGIILRISGHDATTPIQTSNSAESNVSGSAKTFAAGVTPSTANSLLLMWLGSRPGVGGSFTWSSQAIATSNPTWTEQLDSTNTNVFNCTLSTAIRVEATGTGNTSASMSYSGTADAMGQLIVVNPASVNSNFFQFM